MKPVFALKLQTDFVKMPHSERLGWVEPDAFLGHEGLIKVKLLVLILILSSSHSCNPSYCRVIRFCTVDGETEIRSQNMAEGEALILT